MVGIGWALASALLVIPSAALAKPAVSHNAYGTTPGNRHFEIRVGAGLLGGDTTYSIGGSVTDDAGFRGELWDPLSELKWPLDVMMVTLGARAQFGALCLRGAVAKNATSDAGDMEDSDWGVYYLLSGGDAHFSPESKDIFSTSTTSLDALTVDARVRYEPWRGAVRRSLRRAPFSPALGLGLRYQRFSITGSDVRQHSPTWAGYGLPEDPFAGSQSGPVIEYDVTYVVPFAEIAGSYRFGESLRLEASLGYSPRASARDRDDHLLRSKLSKGSGNGQAWLFDLELRYQATRHWFATLGVAGLFVDTSGTQRQEFYAGEDAGVRLTIDQKITSSQVSGALEVGYGF